MENHQVAASTDAMSLLRPPICRSAGAILDRALFTRTVPIAAARISNVKTISKFKTKFQETSEILKLDKVQIVRPDPEPALAAKGGKCVLLNLDVKPDDPKTWSSVLQEAVAEKAVGVIPFELDLDYSYWTYLDIMTSILPEDAQGEIPVGFATVGHVAHLNLKSEYLPYKKLIAEVLVDKNPQIQTVINKIDDVGGDSEFRTFKYEVLAGPDNMDVEVHEGDCVLRFNWAKVYWNSRLQTEHARLVDLFKEGEAVCDVMAGVGPFALPAGKKGVFVYANDLNPASYEALSENIRRNKVESFVRPYCEDGHTFIHHAVDDILDLHNKGEHMIDLPIKRFRRSDPDNNFRRIVSMPQTMSHFVMNLPATAIDFLPSFNGLYHGHEDLFEPVGRNKLPMVHVHCFSTKSEDNVRETKEICERISQSLGWEVKPGDEDVGIWEVRDVAPKKRMFCASFRLPREVAFRERIVGSMD